MILKSINIIVINVLVFCGLLILVEGSLQVVAMVWPSYDVLFLQPDKAVGWKQVPDLQWEWTGHYWYASDFSVAITTNSVGFRDSDYEITKSPGVKRVALLGDSFIEGVQVPFENTSGQRLERLLNSQPDAGGSQWQVLNFGISNYGVGQYLLTWDQYASVYHPDYVAIFVAKFHMMRTISKFETGAFHGSQSLWVRPTFRIEDGRLILEDARDFEQFVKAQNDLIREEFGGKRWRRKQSQLLSLYFARQFEDRVLSLTHRILKLTRLRDSLHDSTSSPSSIDPDVDMLAVNLQIIRELGKKISHQGARLLVLDVSRYFGDDEAFAKTLEDLCTEQGFGYIPAYSNLLEANSGGVSTRWVHDSHFNNEGNEILARSIFSWLRRHSDWGSSIH
jgi:lysophospholipase L1-like esterase